MRVLIFLLAFSVAAVPGTWAGNKQKTFRDPKPSPKAEAEHRLSKEEVAEQFNATFIKEEPVLLTMGGQVMVFPAWRFEMKGNFPNGALPFYVHPQPTSMEVTCAFLSSCGTTEAYLSSIIRDSQKKSAPVPESKEKLGI